MAYSERDIECGRRWPQPDALGPALGHVEECKAVGGCEGDEALGRLGAEGV